MSYRLINANVIAESYPEVNDMSCIYADLPFGFDDGYYDMRESGELQHENAELRMLIEDMWHDLQVYGYTVSNILEARYVSRMRNLGVVFN